MSLSAEIPFSRSSTPTASTISLDICLLPTPWARRLFQQVAAIDLRVRDRHDAIARGHGDLFVRGSDQLTGEAPVPIAGLARAHAGPTTQEAAVVVGLGQRT